MILLSETFVFIIMLSTQVKFDITLFSDQIRIQS